MFIMLPFALINILIIIIYVAVLYLILFCFQITLSRAMAALSIWQKMKLAWHLITTKDPIRWVITTVETK